MTTPDTLRLGYKIVRRTMDPITVLQAWAKKYEVVSTDIKLELDHSNAHTFKYTLTGYIQPKCTCADVTGIDETKRHLLPTTRDGCLVHPTA